MKDHLFYKFSVFFLAVVCIFSIIMLYLLFAPITVIKANVQPYKVLTPNVKVGQQIVYQVDACKYMDVSGMIERNFVSTESGILYPALVETNNISSGCSKTRVSTTVPLFLPTGDYYISLRVVYKVNVMRDEIYNFKTVPFHVYR